jgi:hypothetical protein
MMRLLLWDLGDVLVLGPRLGLLVQICAMVNDMQLLVLSFSFISIGLVVNIWSMMTNL